MAGLPERIASLDAITGSYAARRAEARDASLTRAIDAGR